MRTQSEICADMRRVLDQIDEHNAAISKLNADKANLQREALAYMEAQGLTSDGDKINANGVTLTRADKWRVEYDPEKWPDTMKWAIDSGYGHIVQRRLSVAPILELADRNVPLPDGIKLVPYTDLSHRRS